MATTINANNTDGVVITPDTSGELELQANGVTKAKVTANGLQDANGASLRGGSFRNLIINGDMNIAQRGTSVTGITTSAYRTVDRFKFSIGTAGTFTMTQDTDVPSGYGFNKSTKLSCTTANASLSAGSVIIFEQKFEGQMLQHLKYGTSNAEKLTLSFWVKTNKTGTYICEIYENDNGRQISQSYTVNTADTWQKITLTYDGDTVGALDNDNATSLTMVFWLGAGSTYTSGTLNTSWASSTNANRAVGCNNLADSTSNYINITGVQLEVGEGASDFEFLPYDVQLARCHRYYQIISIGNGVVGAGMAYSTTAAYYVVDFMTQMRTSPVADMTGNFRYYRGGSSALTSTFALSNATPYKTRLSITGSGLTVGHGSWLQTDATTLAMDAEL